jgi:putative Holliday junction resolvase
MKVLALDFGSARTGVAVSDPTGLIARPLGVVEQAGTDAGLAELCRLIAEEGPERVVVGLPLTLRGTRGEQAKEAERFAEALGAVLDVPVELHDERLSTVEAERALRTAGASARDRRSAVDRSAATVILQSFLDAGRGGSSGANV